MNLRFGFFSKGVVLLFAAVFLAACATSAPPVHEPPPQPPQALYEPPPPQTVYEPSTTNLPVDEPKSAYEPPPPLADEPPTRYWGIKKGDMYPIGSNVAFHVWGELKNRGGERTGYAIHTYVLFGSDTRDINSADGKRYDGLLRAIIRDTKTVNQGKLSKWPLSETNIFWIPATQNLTQDNAFMHYNFNLGMVYLGVFQKAGRNDLFFVNRLSKRPGPFLVSVNEPLDTHKGRRVTRLLYVDLTNMPCDGMREIVDVYKQRLQAEPLKNVEKLRESLKIIFLKYALKFDESVKIVKVAYADFKPN